MHTILVVDDDLHNFEMYKDLLGEDYQLIHALDLKSAIAQTQTHKPDLVIMDFFLGAYTGADCCKAIRSLPQFGTLPIIFVSSSDRIEQKREAFESGANDYLSKPFDSTEFGLRIAANLRHAKVIYQLREAISIGNMVINPIQRSVTIEGKEIKLTAREYSILHFLVENRNQIVSSKDLIEKVWGDLNITQGNIYTQMYNLKIKLKQFSGELMTLNRVGFRLVEKRNSPHAV